MRIPGNHEKGLELNVGIISFRDKIVKIALDLDPESGKIIRDEVKKRWKEQKDAGRKGRTAGFPVS